MVQHRDGRLLLHEHSQQASSWDEECIAKMLSTEGVHDIDMDQCQLGQKDESGNPVKKPTRWISNSKCILDALAWGCGGRHGWCDSDGQWRKHTPCHGRVATAAAIYPFRLCKAILQGLVEEMKNKDRWDAGARLVMPPMQQQAAILWAR